MNTTYCSKSWTDINIDFESRTLRHCCKAEGHSFPEKLTEQYISLGDIVKERRQQSLQNIAHSDCNSCWDNYAKGNSAYRDWANRWDDTFLKNNEWRINDDDKFIHYVEIKTDRTCDLACLYCSAGSSSKIAQEEGVTIEDATNEDDYTVFKSWIKNYITREDINAEQIVFIFLGGEPTASERFYELVDYIEDSAKLTKKKIRLEICTNANSKKFLMDKVIARMDTSVLSWGIGISNESFGEDAEGIRHGLNWQRFGENFKRYIQHPKTELIVMSPTVNIFNLKTFHLYITWVYEQFRLYAPEKEFTWYGNFISWPDELDISHLPADYVKYIELAEQAFLKETGNEQHLYKENFVTFMDTMKQRLATAYNPEYKQVAIDFLQRKQTVKKTDKLIRLMNNLDL